MRPIDEEINELKNRGYIVESGSNDNGSWIKYSDGTMICKHILNLGVINYNTAYGFSYDGGAHIWNFPKKFININNLIVNASVDLDGGIGGVTLYTKTTITAQIFVYSVKNMNLGTRINCLAIGKWK